MSNTTQRTKNQLTDVALAQGWESNQLYREEAQMFTKDFLTKFGIYVGLYNRLNNTTYSVEQALWTPDLVKLFMSTASLLKNNVSQSSTKVKQKSKPKSTKALSYEQFQVENGTSVAHSIYTFMKQTQSPMSRADIAKHLGIRLSTVCGQIFPMEEAGLVAVVGTKIDENSNRTVELLVAR